MTPKLANKAFSAKSTQYMHLERHKDLTLIMKLLTMSPVAA
jgi:hypothetical protein